MKDTPPCFARAIASFSPDTACMIAETMGIFIRRGHSSCPFLYLTRGVLRLTAEGMHSEDE
jgi:hypothetical protein